MNDTFQSLQKKFCKIRKMGYVKSIRSGPTGIGKTFEDLIGKKEDRLETPDYHGIEIKTRLGFSGSSITLFHATPKGKNEYEIKRLRDKYGYSDSTMRNFRVLQNSVYGNVRNCIGNRSFFKLKIDYLQEKVYLEVTDKNLNLIEQDVYWTFSDLKEKFYNKLQYLALVKANRKITQKEVYYKYYQMNLYKAKNFNNFLRLLEEGNLRVTFHIGVFKSGERLGEIHDRGTSFEIQEKDLDKLFDRLFI